MSEHDEQHDGADGGQEEGGTVEPIEGQEAIETEGEAVESRDVGAGEPGVGETSDTAETGEVAGGGDEHRDLPQGAEPEEPVEPFEPEAEHGAGEQVGGAEEQPAEETGQE